MNKRTLFLASIFMLYAATWIGGYITHSRDLAARAAESYLVAHLLNREGLANDDRYQIPLHEDGPKTGIGWCVPVLPGVLVLNSYSTIGPLSGGGSDKMVLYYGISSIVIAEGGGWRS